MSSRGVVFDMDGVLVDSGAAHRESWQLLGRELSRPISSEEFDKTFGRSSRDIIRILWGDTVPEDTIFAWDTRKEALYRESIRGKVPLMPGAREILDYLVAQKYLLAIGSSGPRENIEMIVEALGAEKLFSAVVTGFDVTRGKPDPQVFLLAAEKLGLSPENCTVIEDAPAGIEAGLRAGMKVIALASSHPKHELSKAQVIVDHLSELTRHL
jgi:beta-phosphoglucomutase